MDASIIKKVRRAQPLIHHLTNQVVMNFTANGLLAFGGSPIMAKAKEEAEDIGKIVDGVLINIGTVMPQDVQSMILAGKTANERDIPVVFDPVGVKASSFRNEVAKEILQVVRPTIIKGNASELAYLANIPWESKGVDSVGTGDVEEVAIKIAQIYETTVVLTGETDVICTGEELIHNMLGHELLTRMTGAGCLLGSIITACLTTNDPTELQAKTAVSFYGLAAQYAATRQNVTGPGTFIPQFIDALSMEVEALRGGNYA
ncbi:hydroxyethylthiazole kinase [Ornithinibacillus halotolerans]|uniref:Hydroxyethylthiazole kinase n=1 Tax=Ornithinibacillus halotolerans TaxID=1274357 RepID=A0A916RVI9_9BACI|nr:hydroxyethylthiazole kinase [Ornithinibacillus halotolerans]GGA72653.1 hydroxyethylthiazole kinase [Ornithinibacillus halotolerans]